MGLLAPWVKCRRHRQVTYTGGFDMAVHTVVDSKPYQSKGGFSLNGVLTLVSGLALVGGVLGYVAHWAAQFFWIVILFPILIGAILGVIGERLVRKARIRNPLVGAAAGLVGGVLAMGCMHYFDYKQFVSQIESSAPEFVAMLALPPNEREEVAAASDDPQSVRQAFAALESFKGYIDYQATLGVELSSAGKAGLNIGYIGTYVYWIVEVLLVGAVTLVMVRKATAEPFCDACDQWKDLRPLGGISGDPMVAAEALERGDLDRLSAAGSNTVIHQVAVYAHLCPLCSGARSPVDLKLTQMIPGKDGKTVQHVVRFVTWPSESLPALADLFSKPPTSPAVAQA